MGLDRSYILNQFLRLIFNISDKEFQTRIWIRALGPECIDFDETCDYFFHEGTEIIKNYKEYGLTEKQHNLLIKFQNILDEFSDNHPEEPSEFIDTPEWEYVVDEAKKVLEAFDYKKL